MHAWVSEGQGGHAGCLALDSLGGSPQPTKWLLLTFGGWLLRSPFGALDTPPAAPRHQAMAPPALPGNLRQQEPSLNRFVCFFLIFSLICIAAANELLKFKSADHTIFLFFPPRSPPGKKKKKKKTASTHFTAQLLCGCKSIGEKRLAQKVTRC